MESTMTEFEENVSFDIDDPDFAPSNLRAVPNSNINAYCAVQFSDITFGVNKCEYIRFSGMGTVTGTDCNGLITFKKKLHDLYHSVRFVSLKGPEATVLARK
ncbi:hypothetical protein K0M31_011255 [Melipona bicolor]|uniref:Uncharacterized protein n=1 Tax=Melipona bicolor TaxID=60889 RepID=A0AA40KUL4_9HYME|nr:hypothetical protein K0M31_011255 [Melipona bicolor]